MHNPVRYLTVLIFLLSFTGCVAVPAPVETYSESDCQTFSKQLTVKTAKSDLDVDSGNGGGAAGAISMLLIYPISYVVAGTAVVANNAVHKGESAIVCREAEVIVDGDDIEIERLGEIEIISLDEYAD